MRRMLTAALLLLLSTLPVAATSTFVIGNSRITFITPHLVRLEYALHGAFLDDSTLFAVTRRPDYGVSVSHEQQGRRHTFTTPAMRLELDADGFPFGQNNLKVKFRMNNKERTWCLTDEQRNNLLGALTTLDAIGSPVERQEGLLSRDGWYLIDDTGTDIYRHGTLNRRSRNHVQDFYLFVYGTDYKAALRSLAAISGHAPMPRKYVHGAWYCRWWPYTADDYRELVAGYHEHGFPLDIMVFDMDWHKKQFAEGTGHAFTRGWTGYSWNRELIPDPAGLIAEFKKQGIHVVLNEHPHDGLRPEDDAYAEFIRRLPPSYSEGGQVPLFDAGDPVYMRHFMEMAHRESDSMGVAFWWLDWQQDYAYPYVRGTTTRHLPWLNEIYYNYSRHRLPDGRQLRGAGFSRWGGWGDHRHPIQFSGDAVGNWPMLRFEVDLTTTSGNAGCFFWAHDIGGFYDGLDPELYTRWTQFGLLSSSLRIHSVVGEKSDRRPWLWGKRQEAAMRRIYRLRAQLMPYIYSSVWQCHTDMLPLNRGLYIEHPLSDEAYRHSGEFYFGDLLIGAPVTQPGQGPDFTVEQQVWLPDSADWYSLFTHRGYAGGQTHTVSCPLEETAVFVKGGHPLPMQPYRERMTSAPLDTLVIRCYPGRNGQTGAYTLYEDDGLTTAYEQQACATTRLTYRRDDDRVSLGVAPTQGTFAGQLPRRAYRFELPGVEAKSTVRLNGRRVRTVSYSKELEGLIINLPAQPIGRALTLTVSAR